MKGGLVEPEQKKGLDAKNRSGGTRDRADSEFEKKGKKPEESQKVLPAHVEWD